MLITRHKFVLIHVATVSQSLYYFLDGQARFMVNQGVDVHGVSSPGELLEAFADREGVAVHAVEMPRAISPLQDLLSVFRLYSLFRRLKPQIVHAHTPKGGLLGMIAAFLARVPVRIYHVHGLPHVTATGIKRRLLCFTEKISCSLAHRVFCVSASLSSQVCAEKLSRGDKVRMIHNGSINGVDAVGRFDPAKYDGGSIRDSLNIARDALVVGFVGRLVKDKGILELVDAWNELRIKFKNLHLLLIGPFEKKDGIPESVRQILQSDDRVHLIGHISDPAPFYTSMDVLAFPTHREGFGLVAIEASAMQVPVVATCIPGCVDSITDGVTGTLVPSGEAAALEEALATYLGDSLLRRHHGEAGRKRALGDFQPHVIWENLYAEYLVLLNNRGETEQL